VDAGGDEKQVICFAWPNGKNRHQVVLLNSCEKSAEVLCWDIAIIQL